MARSRLLRIASRLARWALWAVFLLSLLVGFGITGGERIAAFREAVGTWPQKDFRHITWEYATLGHEAMRSGVVGVPAGRIVMILRSVPGLPESLAANPGSELHYQRFNQGPLSAYLHLSSEQGPGQVGLFEKLAANGPPDDDTLQKFLSDFKLNAPISTTPQAVQSLRRLLADTDANRPYAIRDVVGIKLLQPHIDAIALREGIPSVPDKMTSAQQYRVLDLLNDQVKSADHELWRAKQVNDFLSGVWGQGYGPTYVGLIDGINVARNIARGIAVAGMAIVVALIVRRRRRQPTDSL